jgi:cytochrome c5
MNKRAAFAVLAGCCVLSVHADEQYPTFDDARLQAGREVWLGTCAACHTSDFAGAPEVTDRAAWAPRLQQDREVLYEHALNGLHGEKGTEMPPRGGNPSLSDEQVKSAVDYMVALVKKLSGE